MIAEDTHLDALHMYSAKGYREVARRTVVKSDWHVDAKDWLLLAKSVG